MTTPRKATPAKAATKRAAAPEPVFTDSTIPYLEAALDWAVGRAFPEPSIRHAPRVIARAGLPDAVQDALVAAAIRIQMR